MEHYNLEKLNQLWQFILTNNKCLETELRRHFIKCLFKLFFAYHHFCIFTFKRRKKGGGRQYLFWVLICRHHPFPRLEHLLRTIFFLSLLFKTNFCIGISHLPDFCYDLKFLIYCCANVCVGSLRHFNLGHLVKSKIID